VKGKVLHTHTRRFFATDTHKGGAQVSLPASSGFGRREMKIGYRWKKKKKIKSPERKKGTTKGVFQMSFHPHTRFINLGQTKMEEKKEKIN
jgi:hypothetical protein